MFIFDDKPIIITKEMIEKLNANYEKNKHLYQHTFQGAFHSKGDLYEELFKKQGKE